MLPTTQTSEPPPKSCFDNKRFNICGYSIEGSRHKNAIKRHVGRCSCLLFSPICCFTTTRIFSPATPTSVIGIVGNAFLCTASLQGSLLGSLFWWDPSGEKARTCRRSYKQHISPDCTCCRTKITQCCSFCGCTVQLWEERKKTDADEDTQKKIATL